jgi:hydrogenase maturation protease
MSLIVGIGSPHGDDQVGWIVAERLHPRLPAGIAVQKIRGGLELVECLGGHAEAILIDATAPAGRPGTIRAFPWPCSELELHAPFSTHDLGLVAALRLAEALGKLPSNLRVYAIEARDTSPGAYLSAEVGQQLESVVETVLSVVAGWSVPGADAPG